MTASSANPRQRRRGAELEAALLDAAWDELVDVGFVRLTMESVAARAKTGVAVLYRRWTNKDEMVLGALQHHRSSQPVDIPDTGSLRGDLLAALTGMGEERASFFTVAVIACFSGLLASSGLSPAQVRERIFGDQPAVRIQAIYRRAEARGEIDLKRTPAGVLDVPYDLVRHDLFMRLEPVTAERIRSIVDELFLPLVEHYRGSRPSGRLEDRVHSRNTAPFGNVK